MTAQAQTQTPPLETGAEHSPQASDPLAGIPDPLARAMRKRGFTELTSVQRAVLDVKSAGRDLRITSQTGSGKTVAIGLVLARHLSPAPVGRAKGPRGPSVLVLVPTRELAMQVRDELRWLFSGIPGLGVEVVMGGTSLGHERRALARGPRVVVGTPGRTLDHLKTGALRGDAVEHVVLDESDRMLDMGFREELESILERMPAERRTHLISATFPVPVQRLATRFQRDILCVEGTQLGAANSDIAHLAHVVDTKETYAALVNLLLLNEGERCLIFVKRRVEATELAKKLSGDGFPVLPFSGELAQTLRTQTLAAFRDGTISTLVSTDVAARGIDVPDIAVVIHLDPPQDADSYVHRSGRTGRAGRPGRSVMVVAPRKRRYVTRLLAASGIELDWQPAPCASKVRKKLRKRFRRQLYRRLADTETHPGLDYAAQLLEGRDPAAVVALLLELAEPTPVCEPLEVREPGSYEHPAAGTGTGGFVRFTINWGARNGAAPNRLLALLCRRGQIPGRSVGSISIGHDESTFELDASVVARFERSERRPDSRDPHMRIVRSDQPGGRGNSRHRGSRRQGGGKGRHVPGKRRATK